MNNTNDYEYELTSAKVKDYFVTFKKKKWGDPKPPRKEVKRI